MTVEAFGQVERIEREIARLLAPLEGDRGASAEVQESASGASP